MLKPKDRVGVDISGKQVALAHQNNPDLEFVQQSGEELQMDRKFDYIILSETVNFAADVQAMFEQLHGVSHSSTRILINFHSALWRPLFSWGLSFV